MIRKCSQMKMGFQSLYHVPREQESRQLNAAEDENLHCQRRLKRKQPSMYYKKGVTFLIINHQVIAMENTISRDAKCKQEKCQHKKHIRFQKESGSSICRVATYVTVNFAFILRHCTWESSKLWPMSIGLNLHRFRFPLASECCALALATSGSTHMPQNS